MANPNIIGATSTTLLGTQGLATTTVQNILNNAAASGQVIRIDSLYICNYDGTNTAVVTVFKYDQASLGGVAYEIVDALSVPAKVTQVVVDKDSPIFMNEDTSLAIQADTNGDLTWHLSYTVFS